MSSRQTKRAAKDRDLLLQQAAAKAAEEEIEDEEEEEDEEEQEVQQPKRGGGFVNPFDLVQSPPLSNLMLGHLRV
jgi:hypothetical protein